MIRTSSILGWDIGGVNTKVALVVGGTLRDVQTRPFELQRAPGQLAELLRDMATGLDADATVHAVTMTAELSQMFRTKAEGVGFVLDSVERAFPAAAIHVYTTARNFISTSAAREHSLLVAAANWMATGRMVAQHHPDALLIDVGSTTTDLIPILAGEVVATGKTDPQRLVSGELVYSGAVRTPIEAIVREVPLAGGSARVSAEGFALTGDAHVWLGTLRAEDYEAATPDGRPSTREFAGERLARGVCADRDLLDEPAITVIAQTVARDQIEQIATAIRGIVARHPSITTAVVIGLGAFIGAAAARSAGLTLTPLSCDVGASAARSAPAAAVALLLSDRLQPLTVVKLGGNLLESRDQWATAVAALASSVASPRVVVVPGGGPFADQVREIDRRIGLSDSAAHWMAIAAMDQHAELIAGADPRFVRVAGTSEIREAHARSLVPVIAPLQWLRGADPLPHSWDVTSDSIAAWIAGALEATRLVLVKPRGASGSSVVDPYFSKALPPDLPWTTCAASELAAHLQAVEPARQ